MQCIASSLSWSSAGPVPSFGFDGSSGSCSIRVACVNESHLTLMGSYTDGAVGRPWEALKPNYKWEHPFHNIRCGGFHPYSEVCALRKEVQSRCIFFCHAWSIYFRSHSVTVRASACCRFVFGGPGIDSTSPAIFRNFSQFFDFRGGGESSSTTEFNECSTSLF